MVFYKLLNGYKAFCREIIANCCHHAKGFEVEIEIAAQAVRKGYLIVEVSTHENRRSGGIMKSHALREGSCYRLWRLFHWKKAGKQPFAERRSAYSHRLPRSNPCAQYQRVVSRKPSSLVCCMV